MHPALSEFVFLFAFCVEVAHQMVQEANNRLYFSSNQMETKI